LLSAEESPLVDASVDSMFIRAMGFMLSPLFLFTRPTV